MPQAKDESSTWTWVLLSIPLNDLTDRCHSSKQARDDIIQWLRDDDLPYRSKECPDKNGDREFWDLKLRGDLQDNWAEERPRQIRSIIRPAYRGGTLASQWEAGSTPFAATNPAIFSERLLSGRYPRPVQPEQRRQRHTRIIVPYEIYEELRNKRVPIPLTQMLAHKAEASADLVPLLVFSDDTQEEEETEAQAPPQEASLENCPGPQERRAMAVLKDWYPTGEIPSGLQIETIRGNLNNDPDFQKAENNPGGRGDASWPLVKNALAKLRYETRRNQATAKALNDWVQIRTQ